MMDKQNLKEIWTLAEQKKGKLNDVSFELLAWGRRLIPDENYILCSVLLSNEIDNEEVQKLIEYGADRVYLIKNVNLEDFCVDPYVAVLTELVEKQKPDVMIAAATSTGRTIMPYLSARIHGGLTADCTGLEIDRESGLLLQTRPAIGGNILATIKTPFHRPQMSTVRPKSISIPLRTSSRPGEIIHFNKDFSAVKNRTQVEKFIPFTEEGPSIESANVVVAGGKGIKNKNNFIMIEELADCLGGAVGSSRPPVDQGWTPYSTQVGLSGKTISPELYIACGISGTVQHLAGIQTAHNIIAINNDPNAQIFQVSDFGVVADLFDFLPVLLNRLKEFSHN